jgi:hypothetical protein
MLNSFIVRDANTTLRYLNATNAPPADAGALTTSLSKLSNPTNGVISPFDVIAAAQRVNATFFNAAA